MAALFGLRVRAALRQAAIPTVPGPILTCCYTQGVREQMERKIFWITFTILGLVADLVLPLWWALFQPFPSAC